MHYVIGDLQGCYDELIALLKQVNFDPQNDHLFFLGDLVARGKQSLQCLEYIYSLGSCAQTVLGNHDLHLIAIHHGIRKAKPQDRLENLLNSPKLDSYINWLKQQPLLIEIPEFKAVLAHAGISPEWTLQQAKQQAIWAQEKLSSEQVTSYLQSMYGNGPSNWNMAVDDEQRFRYTINAFTRMRFFNHAGEMEFSQNNAPDFTPDHIPWYELSELKDTETTLLFGHWAALMGQCPYSNIIGLDTGCVWGNHLSMMCLETKHIYTQPAFN